MNWNTTNENSKLIKLDKLISSQYWQREKVSVAKVDTFNSSYSACLLSLKLVCCRTDGIHTQEEEKFESSRKALCTFTYSTNSIHTTLNSEKGNIYIMVMMLLLLFLLLLLITNHYVNSITSSMFGSATKFLLKISVSLYVIQVIVALVSVVVVVADATTIVDSQQLDVLLSLFHRCFRDSGARTSIPTLSQVYFLPSISFLNSFQACSLLMQMPPFSR